jgi:ABC-type amino acid transport substrate-binding protein
MRCLVLLVVVFLLLACPGEGVAEKCSNPVLSVVPLLPPDDSASDGGTETDGSLEIIKRALTDLFGLPVLAPQRPWPRALDDLRHGDIDMIYPILKTTPREKDFVFTIPVRFLKWGVVLHRDTPIRWRSVESLDGLRGGYLNGVSLPEPYKSFTAGHMSMSLPSKGVLVKMLVARRVDYVIISDETFANLLQDTGEFVFISESAVSVPIRLAISRLSSCAGEVEKINDAIRRYADRR